MADMKEFANVVFRLYRPVPEQSRRDCAAPSTVVRSPAATWMASGCLSDSRIADFRSVRSWTGSRPGTPTTAPGPGTPRSASWSMARH